MKRKSLLTFCLLWISLVSFAGKFVLIPLTETHDLVTLFNNKDLKIHYYCDDYVLATTENLSYAGTIVLDDYAFENDRPYAIVHCFDNHKEDYLARNSNSAKALYSGKDFLLMKYLSDGFVPAKNDGIIMVRDKEARLPKAGSHYPVITEIDPAVQSLIEKVDTDSLMATIQHLQDYGTRGYFKPQAYEAQDWLKTKFEAMGLDVELQSFSAAGNWLGPDTSSANVIAIQRGTKYPDEYIVFGAHYDSGPVMPSYSWDNCPGADDNASGVSGLLEIARILSQSEFERSIIYCCFSAEEAGLYGSDAYATRCRQQDMNIVGYFNFDMIGYLKPGDENHIVIINPKSAQNLANYYMNICDIYFHEIYIGNVFNVGDFNSDHGSFNLAGYFGISTQDGTTVSTTYPPSPYYHTSDDVVGLSVNSPEQAAVITKAALAGIATLAMYDQEMPPVPLAPPTNCIAQHSQSRIIKITWEAPVENTPNQYCIYRDGVKIATKAKSPYNDLLYPNDYDLHCYKVTADYMVESEPTNESCASVPNNITEFNQTITIYPNPANDKLYIEGEFIHQNVEIFDINGKLVANKITDSNVTEIDISNLIQGVYFVKISNEVVEKFVKK